MNEYSKLLIFCFFLGLNPLNALIGVPSYDVVLSRSDVILIGHFEENSNYEISVDEVLKSPVNLPSKVKIYSPYTNIEFSFDNISMKIGSKNSILIGKWDEKKQAVIPNYAAASFWPQGIPKSYLPSEKLLEDIDELRQFILSQIKSSNKTKADIHSIFGKTEEKDTQQKIKELDENQNKQSEMTLIPESASEKNDRGFTSSELQVDPSLAEKTRPQKLERSRFSISNLIILAVGLGIFLSLGLIWMWRKKSD